jgi:hypothetical protein
MLKFIKSAIADSYYRKALHLMGISSPGLALETIKKAVRIEPYEKYIPRFLSLQGELEWGLGFKEKALTNLKLAKQIVEKYPNYWNSDDHSDLVVRINEALSEFEKIAT